MSDKSEKIDANERMGLLRPRNTEQARANSHRYSRMVDMLRWLLPVTILLGLGLLIAWPMWHANHISAVMVDNVPNLMVEKLNLTGVDGNNQAYSLTAERALQAANTKNLIDLEKPEGELALQDGTWVAGHANKGRLDQKAKRLWLSGNVELFHDRGYRFTSDEMNVDLAKSTAWGDQPIVVQSDFGEIEGIGFRLLGGGKTIFILGPATARLDLQRISHSDKENINHSTAR